MKLASYRVNNQDSFGIVTDKGIVDLSGKVPGVTDLKGLLRAGLDTQALGKLAAAATEFVSVDAVSFLPVIPNPDGILCIGMNTYSHCAEVTAVKGKDAKPVKPTMFQRMARTQVGHKQALEKPNASPLFDYEGEIAIIIGKKGRHISKRDALSYIAGYSCYNDASVRDYQLHSAMFTAGKNFPKSGGFGPWLVTADEIPSPEALKLTTTVNGTVVQTMGYDDLIYPFPDLISYISEFTDLLPGDVIVTGSAAGVSLFRRPPMYLKDGDVCEVTITGIGTLSNPVKEAEGAARAPVTRTNIEEVLHEALAFARSH